MQLEKMNKSNTQFVTLGWYCSDCGFLLFNGENQLWQSLQVFIGFPLLEKYFNPHCFNCEKKKFELIETEEKWKEKFSNADTSFCLPCYKGKGFYCVHCVRLVWLSSASYYNNRCFFCMENYGNFLCEDIETYEMLVSEPDLIKSLKDKDGMLLVRYQSFIELKNVEFPLKPFTVMALGADFIPKTFNVIHYFMYLGEVRDVMKSLEKYGEYCRIMNTIKKKLKKKEWVLDDKIIISSSGNPKEFIKKHDNLSERKFTVITIDLMYSDEKLKEKKARVVDYHQQRDDDELIWDRINDSYKLRGIFHAYNNNCQHYCSFLLCGNCYSLQSSEIFQTVLFFNEFLEKMKEGLSDDVEANKIKRKIIKKLYYPGLLTIGLVENICLPKPLKEQICDFEEEEKPSLDELIRMNMPDLKHETSSQNRGPVTKKDEFENEVGIQTHHAQKDKVDNS